MNETPTTVPCDNDVAVTVTSPLRHRCPFVDEVDDGTVTITWEPLGSTYELHSLAEYLHGFKDSEISHEAISDRIRHDLSAHLDIHVVSVETTWMTAGMEVSCSTLPTHAAVTP